MDSRLSEVPSHPAEQWEIGNRRMLKLFNNAIDPIEALHKRATSHGTSHVATVVQSMLAIEQSTVDSPVGRAVWGIDDENVLYWRSVLVRHAIVQSVSPCPELYRALLANSLRIFLSKWLPAEYISELIASPQMF